MTRNTFAIYGLLIVIIAPIVVAGGACGSGQDSTAEEEQDQEGSLFATDPFALESGLAIVEMTHQGEGDFVVNLLSAKQEETVPKSQPMEFSGDPSEGEGTEAAFALAKGTGPANVSKAVHIPTAGEHVFDVKADGPWAIRVEQPHPSSAPETTSFSGEGDTVTSFFELSNGPKQVTMTNPLKTKLDISLLDKDGNKVGSALAHQTDQAERDPPTDVSTTVDIAEDGIYLFDIQTDGLWTIEIADVEEPGDTEQPSSVERGTNTPIAPSILAVLLINLAWILVFAVAIRLRRLKRKRA